MPLGPVDFMVMEYIDGVTLAERLDKGPLPFPDVLRYGIQIADGLDKAHRAGVVHRNVKPGNLMLGPLGIKILPWVSPSKQPGNI
jgi:serine/threonine protein kinase